MYAWNGPALAEAPESRGPAEKRVNGNLWSQM